MAIDIRANVTCSLGELISGQINDSFVQPGIVTVSGSCVLKGLQTPAMGSVVTFSYSRSGSTTQIPRQLRVLSYFADPFRNTTEVQLGCRLTYLSEVKPLPAGATPETAGDPEEPTPGRSLITPRELNCRYPDTEFPTFPGDPNRPGNPALPGYLNASALLSEACARLGLTRTGDSLTAKYYIDSFDFSGGYVNAISQLLAAESKFGFINSNGSLEVRSLESTGGEGPVVDVDSIIDISPIGLGEIVPGKVVVRYNSLRLRPLDDATVDPENPDQPPDEGDPDDPTDDPTPVYDNWERSEVVGAPTTVQVPYRSFIGGANLTAEAKYIPFSETITTYGAKGGFESVVFNNETCEYDGGFADFPDLVIKRETRTRTILAEANGNYCSQVLSTRASTSLFETANLSAPLDLEGYNRVVQTFEYDSKGELLSETTETYEPYFAFLGRLDLRIVYLQGQNYVAVSPIGPEQLISRVITRYETIRASNKPIGSTSNSGRFAPIFKNNSFFAPSDEPVLGQRVITETYVARALTQSGQQTIATLQNQVRQAISAGVPDNSPVVDAAVAYGSKLVLENVDQQTTLNRAPVNVQGRPEPNSLTTSRPQNPGEVPDDVAPQDPEGRIENQEELEVVSGSVSSPNLLETSLPLSPDDVYNISGSRVDGQGSAFARKFGRAQLRLIVGRRYGANLQLAVDKVPGKPFSPIYLLKDGLMVQYRSNATSWAFSSDGVAVGTDALFMGVTGGSGTPWVPVAPGVTSFPALPVITDGTVDPEDPPLPPVAERVVAFSGIRLSLLASSLPYSMNPEPVEARPGIRVGLFATAVQFEHALVGVRLGLEVIGMLRTMAVVTPGIALGTDTISQRGTISTVSTGIRLGLRGGIDPEYEYVLALLRMNGSNFGGVFLDESRYARSVNVTGDVFTDTSQKKYGSASGSFNVVTPFGGLMLGANTLDVLGADSFTIEAWVRNNGLSGAGEQVLASYGSTLEGAWQLVFLEGNYAGAGPYLGFFYSFLDNTNTVDVDALFIDFSGFPVGTWRHVAFVRNGSTGSLYVNGVAQVNIFTGTTSHNFGNRSLLAVQQAPQLTVGFAKNNASDTAYTNFYKGRLDDFRLTRGVARYAANFTPPTAELPAS